MTDASANQRVQGEIAESLQRLDRAQLVELLSDLIKIYVIEGTTSAWGGPTVSTSGHPSSSSAGFAELITDLKARFDLPELEYFRVDGDRVSVSVGDQTVRLEGRPTRRRAAPEQPPRPVSPPRDDRPPPKPGERSRFLEVD